MTDEERLAMLRRTQRLRIACNAYASLIRLLFDNAACLPPDVRQRACLDEPVVHRASGGCICGVCGVEYHRHAPHPAFEYLTILCNGTAVKL